MIIISIIEISVRPRFVQAEGQTNAMGAKAVPMETIILLCSLSFWGFAVLANLVDRV